MTTRSFDLPGRRAAKSVPALIDRDEQHFAAVADSLQRQTTDLEHRLDVLRRAPGGAGQAAMDRDMEIHRLSAELRLLERFGLDLCLGRMVGAGKAEPVYIGRRGLTGADGRRLLIDWRAPAAEPFFAATHADPMGLVSRRRYRWTRGRVSDYWDEVFAPDGLEGHAALDDQSAFIASLGGSRSPRMRDVLATIQAEQDAIIRAGSRGTLVVDGGPGTGKTVVALHRAAYLLYSDPRISRGGGVLFVGPTATYLAYVDDVLPSLGEESVRLTTLSGLVPEGNLATIEADPEVARLKASARLVDAIESAVRFHEKPPTKGMSVSTPWADLWLSPAEWAEAFATTDPGTDHNEARAQVWEALVEILTDKVDDDVSPRLLREYVMQDGELARTFAKAWPLLDPAGVVADLWSVPAYLRMCAPWLTGDEVQRLQRDDPRAWTVPDLPLLDAARHRIGDPERTRRERRRRAAIATEHEHRTHVIDNLIAADDDGEGLVTMLRGRDLRNTLVDEATLPRSEPELLAGPFGHIIVDEAQELTDAEWQMLLRRCPSRSFTIVGDRAQASHGFAETWQQRLERLGLGTVSLISLSVNYRTPTEVMAEAEPVIRSVLPDANVPTSIRSNGIPVTRGSTDELEAILEGWLTEHTGGIACVIGDPAFTATARVRSLTPKQAKGLEFDLVVLVDSDAFGRGIEGAVGRYVAMTRTTERLVILSGARGR